jgi:hypothetical protein
MLQTDTAAMSIARGEDSSHWRTPRRQGLRSTGRPSAVHALETPSAPVARSSDPAARPGSPFFLEEDFSPEERVNAIAELLLKGVTRAIAKKRVEKTRRWRLRKAETTERPSGPGTEKPQ